MKFELTRDLAKKMLVPMIQGGFEISFSYAGKSHKLTTEDQIRVLQNAFEGKEESCFNLFKEKRSIIKGERI